MELILIGLGLFALLGSSGKSSSEIGGPPEYLDPDDAEEGVESAWEPTQREQAQFAPDTAPAEVPISTSSSFSSYVAGSQAGETMISSPTDGVFVIPWPDCGGLDPGCSQIVVSPPPHYSGLDGAPIDTLDIGKAVRTEITGGPDDRRPDLLFAICVQFGVKEMGSEHGKSYNPRYRPRPWGSNRRKNRTFCVTYLEDVMRALRANYLRHGLCTANYSYLWLKGDLKAIEDGFKGWLARRGNEHAYNGGPAAGWREVDINAAISRANAGFPTIAALYNPGGTGHVAVLIPGGHVSSAGANQSAQVQISQAGGRNLLRATIASGFGSDATRVSYFTHD